MPQSNDVQALKELSDLCQQLTDIVRTDPIDKMQNQLTEHQARNEENLQWLDEAMALLSELTQVDEAAKAPKIIAKVESFISKAGAGDYHVGSLTASKSLPTPSLAGIEMPGCGEFAKGEVPKKN